MNREHQDSPKTYPPWYLLLRCRGSGLRSQSCVAPSSGERGRGRTFSPQGSTSGSGRADRKERSALTHAHPLSVNQKRLKNHMREGEVERSSMYALNDRKEIRKVFNRMSFAILSGMLWGQCVILELCQWESFASQEEL